MSSRHQVVITGIGLVTPVGNDAITTWQALIAGKSGISKNDRFSVGDYPCTVAGLVRGEQESLDLLMSQKNQTKADRFIHLAMLAGSQAMRDAGLCETLPEQRDRFGAYIGVGVGGLSSIVDGGLQLQNQGMRRISPFLLPRVISNQAAGWLSMQWQLQGPITAIVNACSSGADALGLAFRAIRDGYADYMLAGGTESCITPVSIAGFGNMRALTQWSGDPAQASRPFERNRSGFVMAEGAGIIVLERKDLAEKRGAQIYAEIVGYGAASDAYHITAMHPDGRGAVTAIEQALQEAQINREKIGYINAHGTATQMNDALETMVIKKVFGNHVDVHNKNRCLVSSTKSMTGHMLGAAGGVEAALCALALKHQVVPPTINLDTPDPVCDLDYVPHQARDISMDYALSNSCAFGGGNSAIILKRV